jgi:hypothetical protein
MQRLANQGAAAWYFVGYWVSSADHTVHMQQQRSARMWADAAQQARPQIAAAQALVERLQRGELIADQMVLQELAGILQQSRCFREPPFSFSQIQFQASASSRHARPLRANAHASSDLLSSACIGSLNIRGKLGGNVQDAASLIDSVGLDILGIQETLHADVDIPGFFWLAPARTPSAQSCSATSRSPLRGIGFLVCDELHSPVSICRRPFESRATDEILWLKISGQGRQLDTFLCNAYAPGPHRGAAICQGFFNHLSEECIHYSAMGDVILIGDFNSRIGVLAYDSAENGNCRRFLEFLCITFSDGVDGCFKSLLNCSSANLGKPIRFDNGHASLIDYLIFKPLCKRIQEVHVECESQIKGANGCGNDDNLLWICWELKMPVFAIVAPVYRLSWNKDALLDESCNCNQNGQRRVRNLCCAGPSDLRSTAGTNPVRYPSQVHCTAVRPALAALSWLHPIVANRLDICQIICRYAFYLGPMGQV